MKLTIDFETRSQADLKTVGAWMYSRHPSTDVLCIGWHAGKDSGQWRLGDPLPMELFHLKDFFVDSIEAHNSWFEFCIWRNVCVEKYGWPAIDDSLWRCSASKAAVTSIPRGLGDAGRALNLAIVKEETEGKWAMQKLSRPRKPTASNPSIWWDGPDDWTNMLRYNLNDVMAEKALSDALPELTAKELKIWQLSEKMNHRGLAVDIEGCIKAIDIATRYRDTLLSRFSTITGGIAPGQRAKFIVWLNTKGVHVTDSQAGTLDDILPTVQDADVKEAITIVRAIGRSSISKYKATLLQADTDSRVRGLFMYHGAGTGRWAGKGIQPHNYPRGGIKDMEKAWEVVYDQDIPTIELVYGDVLKFLSDVLRGSIWAPDGECLMAADFASIETVVLFWQCMEQVGLDVFRRKEDIYCDMATGIYRKPVTKADAPKRQFGKQAILGLGFGMGYLKFFITCLSYDITFTIEQINEIIPAGRRKEIEDWIWQEDWQRAKKVTTREDLPALALMKYVVDQYRGRYRNVPKLWRQYEDGAKRALAGQPNKTGYVSWELIQIAKKPFLTCLLPSGRKLYYPDCRMEDGSITYMTVDAKTKQWIRTKTYGGKLTENITQAIARDVMAEAMLRLDKHPKFKNMVATVHDEIIAQVLLKYKNSLAEFVTIIEQPPDWAPDMPIRAEGFTAKRYRK